MLNPVIRASINSLFSSSQSELSYFYCSSRESMLPLKVTGPLKLHDFSKIDTPEVDWGAQFKPILTNARAGTAANQGPNLQSAAGSDISNDQTLKTGNVCFIGLRILWLKLPSHWAKRTLVWMSQNKESPAYWHLNKRYYNGKKTSQFHLWSESFSLTYLSLRNSHPLITECVCFSDNNDSYINNAFFVPASDQVCNSERERKIQPVFQALPGERYWLNYFHMCRSSLSLMVAILLTLWISSNISIYSNIA